MIIRLTVFVVFMVANVVKFPDTANYFHEKAVFFTFVNIREIKRHTPPVVAGGVCHIAACCAANGVNYLLLER